MMSSKTKQTALIGASVLTAVLCAGCEVRAQFDNKPSEAQAAPLAENADGNMTEIKLKDGTRCVAWIWRAGMPGGLSCDWKHGA